MTAITRAAAVAAALLALAGCTESQFPNPTGKGEIRGVNAVIDAPAVRFRIEQRSLGELQYGAPTEVQQFDDFDYDFNFDIALRGGGEQRLGSTFVDVERDVRYNVVAAGTVANTSVFVWDHPVREWADGDTSYEIVVGHADGSLGTVDVYYLPAGTMPVAGNAVGTLSLGEFLAPIEVTDAAYDIVMTAAGDPGNIVFRSDTIDLAPATTYLVVAIPADPSTTSPHAVSIYRGDANALGLVDVRFPPTIQLVHAAFGTGPVDLARDGDFATPLLSGLAFREVSSDIETVVGEATYAAAPTGNSTPLADTTITLSNGTRITTYLHDTVEGPNLLTVASTRRPIATVARVRVTNLSNNAGVVDVFLRDTADADSVDLPLALDLATGAATDFLQTAGRAWELTVRDSSDPDPNVIGGPVDLTVDTADVLEILVLDTADPNVVDVFVYSNLP